MKYFRKYDEFSVACIMSLLFPFRMTGRICLKSSSRTIVIPPNGLSLFVGQLFDRRSCSVLSRSSKQYLFAIGASSHIISEVFSKSSATCVPLLIEPTESLSGLNGRWNLEWAVLPPGNRSAAIPEVATGKTIFYSDLSLAIIVFHK